MTDATVTSGETTSRALGKRTGCLFLNFFLIILAYYQVKSASRSLLIEYWGSDNFPYVWIASALVLAVSALKIEVLPLLGLPASASRRILSSVSGGTDKDLARLRPAQGEVVAVQLYLDGVPERGVSDQPKLRSGDETHLHQPAAGGRVGPDAADDGALARAQVGQGRVVGGPLFKRRALGEIDLDFGHLRGFESRSQKVPPQTGFGKRTAYPGRLCSFR